MHELYKIVLAIVILSAAYAEARVRPGDPTIATPMAQSADGNTLMTFTTDGCTKFDEDMFASASNVHECCVQHDFRYWLGGTKADRYDADKNLRACIKTQTSGFVAGAVYDAVHLFGRPGTDKPYQWGYGWVKNRGYAATPTASEMSAGFCEDFAQQYAEKEAWLMFTGRLQRNLPPPICSL